MKKVKKIVEMIEKIGESLKIEDWGIRTVPNDTLFHIKIEKESEIYPENIYKEYKLSEMEVEEIQEELKNLLEK